jgi:CRISPR system Cascade subunit CasD
MPVVVLRLEALLQSWSEDASNFSTRNITPIPSFSGVIGVIQATQGIKRNTYDLELSGLRMGVRIDRKGEIYQDFQTGGGGHLPQTLSKLYNVERYFSITADKQLLDNPSTTNRPYLVNASYLVGLEGDIQVVERVRDWLRYQKRKVYLGRTPCQPTRPMLQSPEIYHATLDEVLSSLPSSRKLLNGPSDRFSPIHELHITDDFDVAHYAVNDIPLPNRDFATRYIRRTDVEVNTYEE